VPRKRKELRKKVQSTMESDLLIRASRGSEIWRRREKLEAERASIKTVAMA